MRIELKTRVSRRMAMGWKQTMTGMALWFTDPLAREVEPTNIPGVTEQLMLAPLVDSGVAVL